MSETNYIKYIIFFVFALLGGCGLLKKEDKCESETKCKLAQSVGVVTELTEGDSYIIEVCACRPWNRSWLMVQERQRYFFEVTEITENWKDGRVKSSDPRLGWQGGYNLFGHFISFLKRSTKANWYALVGSVGKNDENSFAPLDTNSEPITMYHSGELYFYANDMNGRYSNNIGVLQLKITRVSDHE
ncbi:hypothetical protein [Nitrosomonas sp. Is79A3]|uniref:hypothetical protein n=1 Tax=Nitrosomonas sp. (strain Is79A3) TaxID=261292 RepID=UPI00059E2145